MDRLLYAFELGILGLGNMSPSPSQRQAHTLPARTGILKAQIETYSMPLCINLFTQRAHNFHLWIEHTSLLLHVYYCYKVSTTTPLLRIR